MLSSHRRLQNIAIATGLLAVFATGAQASADRACVAAVEAHLKSQGVRAEAIAQTKYITEIANLEFGTAHEYQAWTPLASCSGSLVTKLTTSCQVKETYTRGDCGPQSAKTN